jgi:hypothetical protein
MGFIVIKENNRIFPSKNKIHTLILFCNVYFCFNLQLTNSELIINGF